MYHCRMNHEFLLFIVYVTKLAAIELRRKSNLRPASVKTTTVPAVLFYQTGSQMQTSGFTQSLEGLENA